MMHFTSCVVTVNFSSKIRFDIDPINFSSFLPDYLLVYYFVIEIS